MEQPPTFPSEENPDGQIQHVLNRERLRERIKNIFSIYMQCLSLPGENYEAKLKEKGTKVLEVGSGDAAYFGEAALQQGIDITCVDHFEFVPLKDESNSRIREKFVQAKAQLLPFPDRTFKEIISVNAVPQVVDDIEPPRGRFLGTENHEGREIPVYESASREEIEKYNERIKESVAQAITELLRVLKDDGRIRLGGELNIQITNPFILAGLREGVERGEGELIEIQRDQRGEEEPGLFYIIHKKAKEV